MTGYGRGEASNSDVTVVIELKSVNNRFRDIQVRSPREYLAFESRVQSVLKTEVHRGRLEVFVRRNARRPGNQVVADWDLANQYAQVINETAAEMVGFVEREVPFTFILKQEGVLKVSESAVDVMREWDIVETALKVALEDLLVMRKAEGSALHTEFSDLLSEIRSHIDEVAEFADAINERLQARLEGKIRRLIGDRVDNVRLLQEVAIQCDKADITEELTRMKSHCAQFSNALSLAEPIGRRLDFLLQEMNREVNTIGSKAIEHSVSQRVVELKTVLERMREQSANVE